MIGRLLNLGFRPAELRSRELESAEQVLAEFRALCYGVASFNRVGTAFVTNRRVIWLADQLTRHSGRRVVIRYPDMKRCWLKKSASELHIQLRNFQEYWFDAGSERHVQLAEMLESLPGQIREGDRTEQLFEAIRNAESMTGGECPKFERPEFVVQG